MEAKTEVADLLVVLDAKIYKVQYFQGKYSSIKKLLLTVDAEKSRSDFLFVKTFSW